MNYSSDTKETVAVAASAAKKAWHAPVAEEASVSSGTGFACSPCPDSLCTTARAS